MSYDLKASYHSKTRILKVNSTPTEVKLPVSDTEPGPNPRRHHLVLQNLSSYYIWWGFDPSIDLRLCNLLQSGVSVEIPLDRNDVARTRVYAIAEIDDVQLFVTEVV